MSYPGVIVVSIENGSGYEGFFRDKFLGKTVESYYISRSEGLEEVKKLGKSSFRAPFVVAWHDSDSVKLTEMIVGECEIAYGNHPPRVNSESSNAKGDAKGSSEEVAFLEPLCVHHFKKADCEVLLDDIGSYLDLRLGDNYEGSGYVKVEDSESAVEKIRYYIDASSVTDEEEEEERAANVENVSALASDLGLAQEDKWAYRQHSERETDGRAETMGYTLDYERIVHSKAFRRMVDKAQVFSSSKGDHYRTRMTHTMAVDQIARSLADGLGLNVRLTEAIALAHDIGHTPFGHQGERTLDDILRNRPLQGSGLFEANEGKKDKSAECGNPFGGFKHNFQSVRVLTSLEENHVGYRGLNLSAQVLEGALWHTKAPKMEDCPKESKDGGEGDLKPSDTFCDVDSFWDSCGGESDKMKDYVFHQGIYADDKSKKIRDRVSLTLEGQAVAMADEIAQRSHDIDDALAAGLLTIDELLDVSQIRSIEALHNLLIKEREKISITLDRGFMFIDSERLLKDRIASKIVNYLIVSAIEESKKRIESLPAAKTDPDFGPLFKDRIIAFTDDGQKVCDYLESVVTRRVLSSSDVSRFDHKARMVVKGLFAAYYEQPMMLPRSSLRRIAIMERNDGCKTRLDLSNCSSKAARKEIRRMQEAATESSLEKPASNASCEQEYAYKKKLLVRAIVDHISGMTDSYALLEHRRIFGASPE